MKPAPKKIELTKWDWLAKKDGLASDRIARAKPGKPCLDLAENRVALEDLHQPPRLKT